MRVSDFARPDEVFRDGAFERLGTCSGQGTALLVFAGTRHFLMKAVLNPGVRAVVTTPELAESAPGTWAVLTSASPRDRFYALHEEVLASASPALSPVEARPGTVIHATASVDPAAQIGRGVSIGEFAVIRARVSIGDDVTIEPGAKVGVDGILHRVVDGRQRLIPHGGRVELGPGVTLMSNSIVVSAIFPGDSTHVGDGSLLGMNAVVGHDAVVGSNVVLSNNVVVARGATVGNGAFIGTSAVVREFVSVGEHAQVMAGSIVITDVADGQAVSGNFATSHGARLRAFSRSHVEVTHHQGGSS